MSKQRVDQEIVLSAKDLKLSFYTDKGRVKALRGVSFDLYKGEVLCIVGESGSGKSVTAKMIMGILPGNARIDGGSIYYQNEDLTKVSEEEFHNIRGKKIGLIFQDPLSSLNPIMRIGKQITEALIINGDKVKRLYKDILSPSLIKYKNALQLRSLEIQRLKGVFLDARAEIRSNETIKFAEATRKIQLLRKKLRHDINTLLKQTKPDIQELKKQVDAKRIEAQKEAKAFKTSLDNAYKEKIATLKAKLSNATPDEKKAIQAQLKTEQVTYINSLRLTPAEAKRRAIKVMEEVGIPHADRRFRQYPFEFSGGMRQRIVIAIALTQDPDVLILDEPTTALDVTIQAQILDLVKKLQKVRKLSAIFITHDLGVVANMADRIAVMYAGKIVEYGKAEEIFYDPKHPYTWALLSSIPDIDSKERLESIPGTPPNMIYPPKGDAFAERSKYAMAIDFKEEPPYFQLSETHFAATWLLDPRSPKADMPRIVSERIKNSLKKAGKMND
jgi:oligopeptide transport system ATP-binding protein